MHLLNRLRCPVGCPEERRRKDLSPRRDSVSAKGRQVDGSTLSFLTLRTSIGRPMRRLNPVCKESVLKPSNPFVLATQRLPPATPGEPGVLTVCCRSPHACGRRPYDKQLKMARFLYRHSFGVRPPYTFRLLQQDASHPAWDAFAPTTAVWGA